MADDPYAKMQQFQGAHHQGFRRKADVKVVVNGRDVTNIMRPHLISVQVVLKLHQGASTCAIELDDTSGVLEIPPDGMPVVVYFGWEGQGPRVPPTPTGLAAQYLKTELIWEASGMRLMFVGFIASSESGFSRRGGGRRLWIEATSNDSKGKGKELQMKSFGSGVSPGASFESMLGGIGLGGGKAMDGSRNFAFMNESPNAFASRMAEEAGGYFTTMGNSAVFTKLDWNTVTKENPYPLPIVEAKWGVNLIQWRIKPYISRPQWAGGRMDWFNLHEGQWKRESGSFDKSSPYFDAQSAMSAMPFAAPNAGVAGQLVNGMKQDSESRRGTGWVIINGEPSCVAGGRIIIDGARSGVDGNYLIKEAEHNYTRQAGYTTRCTLENPQFLSTKGVAPREAISPNAFPAMLDDASQKTPPTS